MEYIGVRKLCGICEHGETKGKDIICKNKESDFYRLPVNGILCAPCFELNKSKECTEVEKVSLG